MSSYQPPTKKVEIPSSTYHVGRLWSYATIEDACPCRQASCGLAVRSEANLFGCPEHGDSEAKTFRQIHKAEDCPGQAE